MGRLIEEASGQRSDERSRLARETWLAYVIKAISPFIEKEGEANTHAHSEQFGKPIVRICVSVQPHAPTFLLWSQCCYAPLSYTSTPSFLFVPPSPPPYTHAEREKSSSTTLWVTSFKNRARR
jgi:hypothetical protein